MHIIAGKQMFFWDVKNALNVDCFPLKVKQNSIFSHSSDQNKPLVVHEAGKINDFTSLHCVTFLDQVWQAAARVIYPSEWSAHANG